ncbi:hypothetical protein IMG5_107330 [Ichthyophthirius multifiliis]|uniref:Aldehyde dehydrogenase domain-containing protein n=1 Tax=Ichthyophthirius multifiliis TaxID=5932 RepID=G0QTD7_ICHMU|nr:hypothetical protein IMG5_107330 [Ichthyophthirius multifiliis]EGR31514.1 hypothetical protein IMG5_107330 [Ichthyophthirius multifiliis]|eukprot:XP_004035000.1 hypothetical protein IMG5_107330 [Ichthyophthirius multifiliis]
MDINRFKRPTRFQTKLFINGQFVDGVKKTTISIYNPSTEDKICDIAEATEQDVELAIDAATNAFSKWKNTTTRERCLLINKLADLIEKNLDELVSLESLDNGKPLYASLSDITEVVNNLRYYAGWADKTTGKSYSSQDNTLFYTRREPFGVVGLISPWNFPLLMCEWKFAPALAAGNCLVHKPSEETPLTILRVAELINEAGFPPGVFNIVPGYGNIAGEALSRSRKVGKISFTGSTIVGRKVMEASAQSNLKKVTLELGGKTPVVVCPSADLDQAVAIAWNAIMYNMGQCCIAGSRLFVHESIYNEFLNRLKAINSNVKIGDAFEGSNHGPQINKVQFNKILGFIEHAKTQESCQLLIGGNRYGNKGYFIEPTIFCNVDDNSKIASEEIFGPVLAILKPWKSLDEVIKRANNTNYGLAGIVLSKDMSVCDRLVRDIQAGTIFVNNYCIPKSYIPFGGYKESGFGKDNGEEGMLEYTQVKAVYYQFDEPKI